MVPDGHCHRPATVLRESELLWLTPYVQGPNDLAPPLPSSAMITGHGPAGFAHEDDILEITVVADPHQEADLEPRLASVTANASRPAPDVRPSISVVSPKQWSAVAATEAHHNVWLAPDTAPLGASAPARAIPEDVDASTARLPPAPAC